MSEEIGLLAHKEKKMIGPVIAFPILFFLTKIVFNALKDQPLYSFEELLLLLVTTLLYWCLLPFIYQNKSRRNKDR